MKLQNVTKFVLTGLFMALAACSNKSPKEPSKLATGLNSKTGQALTSQLYCSEGAADQGGKVSVTRFRFEMNGTLVVTQMQLQTDGSMAPQSEDNATWSVINDQLYMMSDKTTMQMKVERVSNSDGGLAGKGAAQKDQSCFNLTANSVTQQICPCEM